MGRFLGMNSRVRPKYKTKYRVNNGSEYDRALVQRGEISLWVPEDAIEDWKPATSGGRGGQRKFSDHAIETALMLRLDRVASTKRNHLMVDSAGPSIVGEGEWAPSSTEATESAPGRNFIWASIDLA